VTKARVLLYDLEITPSLCWSYQMWDARILRVERDPYIMSFAYKWLDEDTTHVVAQPDFKLYDLDPFDDHDVAEALHDLLDEADVVIAHNAARFDNRVSFSRFLMNDIAPPSPFKTIDTLQVAKRYFKQNYNTLDSLAQKLGVGQKTKVRHADVWHDCVEGDLEAWAAMCHYNKNDITMLEDVYIKLRPFITNHPNLANFDNDSVMGCPKCGSENMQYRGYQRSNVATYRRVQCSDCGAWSRERVALREDKPEFVNVT